MVELENHFRSFVGRFFDFGHSLSIVNIIFTPYNRVLELVSLVILLERPVAFFVLLLSKSAIVEVVVEVNVKVRRGLRGFEAA